MPGYRFKIPSPTVKFDPTVPQKTPVPPRSLDYNPFPRDNLPGNPERIYLQHREQDRGREIALGRHPRRWLVDRHSEDLWEFARYYAGQQGEVKAYFVRWDGIGSPPPAVSTSTYSQGGRTYVSQGNTYTLFREPDSYTWAVWFFVNGVTPDPLWPPIPSRNPLWPFSPPWLQYPYP